MAGTVKEAKLENRTARARLKRGRQPHWRTIVSGRAHLGYQRRQSEADGRWLLRRYVNGKYSSLELGRGDDALAADGERILSFEQAFAAARAHIDAPKGKFTRITVRQAFEAYVEFKRSQGQPAGDLLSRGTAHILPPLGDKVLADLTAEALRRWLATLAAMPAMKRSPREGKQAYKQRPNGDEAVRRRRSSANRVLNMLKAALNHAFDEGHVANRDAWDRKLKPFRDVDVARVRYLSVGEAQRLINASDPGFRPLVIAALQTGARYGELTRLEVADFNADAGTVTIRRSKTGAARHVVLTGEGVALFRQFVAGHVGSDLVFRRAGGGPWLNSHQARPMKEACERAQIAPPIGFHGLRHTWASLAVMNAVPLLVVAKNMGHKDTRMIERHYGHLANTYIVDAIRTGAPRFGVEADKKITSIEIKRKRKRKEE